MKFIVSITLLLMLFSCAGSRGDVRTADIPASGSESPSVPSPSASAVSGQSANPEPSKSPRAFKKPAEYNFRFVVSDVGIDDYTKDRRCYFRVFIDRIEAGRTTIELESQDKVFETTLDGKRHLITVEKFVLDENKGKFIKLNNIDQPKPDHSYFNIVSDRITVLRLTNHAARNASFFTSEFEQE
jgi:hypothetical protein